jgi:SAM-dependent MidA family methyltransferase
MAYDGSNPATQALLPRFQERHYAVAELLEMWNLSPDVIRKIFEHEAGVLVVGDYGSRNKRRYTTLRIPQSVVERVHRRLCNPDLTTNLRRRTLTSSRDHRLVQTTDGP